MRNLKHVNVLSELYDMSEFYIVLISACMSNQIS